MIPAAYRIDGPPGAPLLLLVNSLGTSMAMWEPQLPAWRARFRVVRVEHRGHGGTPAPPGPYEIGELADDLVELLDHLGEPSASVCGLSIGGMVALSFASRYPDRTDGLVLACTGAALPTPESWRDRAALVRREGTGVLAETLLGRWFTAGFAERQPDVAASVQAMLAGAEAEGYAGCCEAIAAMDLRPDLAAITAPTLVLAGADDPATPPEHGAAIAAAISGARLEVLPGVAHLGTVQAPGAVTSALLAHLRAAGVAGAAAGS
jgi:3-oxoadipate enol-lactonase